MTLTYLKIIEDNVMVQILVTARGHGIRDGVGDLNTFSLGDSKHVPSVNYQRARVREILAFIFWMHVLQLVPRPRKWKWYLVEETQPNIKNRVSCGSDG